MKRLKKTVGFFAIIGLVAISFSMNTKMAPQSDVTLNNIASLTSAQAEYGDIGWCALISTQLCYVNSWTGEVRMGIFQPN